MIGDVAVTTEQCVDGMISPDGFPRSDAGGARGGACGTASLGSLPADERAQLKSLTARGGPAGYNLTQLLLAYEVPNGAEAPESSAFAEQREVQPQSGEYRLSSSYTAELEELYPSGEDTKWAAYASTPVRAYWGHAPRWSSTAPFGLAGIDPTQPFRGPFAFGTVIGSRMIANDAGADEPVDCDRADCDADRQGIGSGGARTLSSSAFKLGTRDLAVARGRRPRSSPARAATCRSSCATPARHCRPTHSR